MKEQNMNTRKELETLGWKFTPFNNYQDYWLRKEGVEIAIYKGIDGTWIIALNHGRQQWAVQSFEAALQYVLTR